jgi:site-specific recombinase XerD
MFDGLFKQSPTLRRQRTGPSLKERIAFLTDLVGKGYSRRSLQDYARDLLTIAERVVRADRPEKFLTVDEVKRRLGNECRLYPLAVRWLRSIGRLKEPPAPVIPGAKMIEEFVGYMQHVEEFRPETIRWCSRVVSQFLSHVDAKRHSLRAITPRQIDVAIQTLLDRRGYSPRTVQSFASSLRGFFRFAEARGWCRKGLAVSVRSPRVYSQSSLPLGPSWEDVRRLLAMTEGNRPGDILARPILMLFAIYGLRRGEVSRLRLQDIDWEHEVFRVVSSKTGKVRTYPLTHLVGNAIVRYLQGVRPRSSRREVFLSLRFPFGPLRDSLWQLVGKRLRSLQVSLPHYGPHSLRHACASRLLAAGLSLKEIGDQLGHLHPDTTRVYAKVDLVGLREVADFELGGVL